MFTLEEHTTYLAELSLNSTYRIEVYIYDYDYKRVHFFLMLYTDEDELAATNEVIMMGIDSNKRKSVLFQVIIIKTLLIIIINKVLMIGLNN